MIDSRHPFPGSKINDTELRFIEQVLENDVIEFFQVRPRLFSLEDPRIKSGQATIFDFYPELKTFKISPKKDTIWIYRLNRFSVKKQHLVSQEILADSKFNFYSALFDNYADLKSYLDQNVRAKDWVFYKDWQTNYPLM